MKSAYEEMPKNLNENSKRSITDNYRRIEKLYKENPENLDKDIFMDIILFY